MPSLRPPPDDPLCRREFDDAVERPEPRDTAAVWAIEHVPPMSDRPTPGATSSIEDQIRLREEKARALRERGLHPYGNDVQVTTTTGHVREVHAADSAEQLEKEHSPTYSIAGRAMAIRTMGKATFLSLRDRTGDLQAFIKKDKVGEDAYEVLKLLDLGDIAQVRGRAMRTKTGELSIEAEQGGFHLLTKALRPLPEKWHGLHDVETRYRQRCASPPSCTSSG